MKNLFLIVVIALGFSVSSFAQQTLSATASSSAKVIALHTISNSTNLDFATVAGSTTAVSTIAMDAAGLRVAAGGAYAFAVGTPTSAKFMITGAENETIAISIPTASILLTGPTAGVTVGTWVANGATATTIPTGGALEVTIGGTLTLPANVAAGTYSNAAGLVVTVDYN